MLWRTAKLFLIGLATQGADFPSVNFGGFNIQTIRIPGILQRIAWAYLCVSLMAMYFPKVNLDWFDACCCGYVHIARFSRSVSRPFGLYIKYALHWLVSFWFLFFYIIMMKQLHVPSYSYFNENRNETYHVHCDTKGDLTEACNAARRVDYMIMGWKHMYSTPEYTRSASCQRYPTFSDCPLPANEAAPWCHVPMDPEGILSSMPAVLTTFIGFHFGNVLIQYPVCGCCCCC